MKICFVGLGSIGTRHLKNLIEILDERQVDYTIDALRSRREGVDITIEKCINKEFYIASDLPNDYDIAFITNPTERHYNTILLMKSKAKHMFVEKPVFDKIDYDIEKFERLDGILYVACPLRYTNLIQYLKVYLCNRKVYSARVICSTYLPEWRMNIDYRKTYSASKELGGGVSIDLIHEWDYLVYLFGRPTSIYKIQGKYSHLEIDSEDIALYTAQYSDKLVSIHLDYFGRYPRREIEIYTDEDVIIGDFINCKIKFLKAEKEIDLREDRNEYHKRELIHFLSMVRGDEKNANPIDLAVDVLKIAKGVS